MTLLSAAIVARAERLRLLSAVDRLTGLFNRGYFDERFAEALSRARRARRPLSLALFDLDEFKRFNDDFGHEAGDVALRAAAEAVVGALRPGDLVARYGGEELVVLFPDTSPEAAAALCEQVRAAIAAVEVPVPRRAAVGRMTTSAGVASWPADGDAGDELLYRADVRLFAAKHEGRNRVVGVDGRDR
jgi:diguanylate cyclase (GGDEF)-like protein